MDRRKLVKINGGSRHEDDRRRLRGWEHHGECGARAYNGRLGAEPLVSGSGGEAPAESESILVIGCPTEPANLAFSKNVLSNFVTRNKVLNHCRVIDAIQKVFMNVQSHNRIQTFGRHG